VWGGTEVLAMTFGYARPFSFQIGRKSGPKSEHKSEPKPVAEPKVASVRPGVTEITLDDGRVIRATLHVQTVTPDPKNPARLDVSYKIVAELVARPEMPILDAHETIQ
jgi:hypothetical protein